MHFKQNKDKYEQDIPWNKVRLLEEHSVDFCFYYTFEN